MLSTFFSGSLGRIRTYVYMHSERGRVEDLREGHIERDWKEYYYFKELVHMIVGIGKFKIHRLAGDSGKSWSYSLESKGYKLWQNFYMQSKDKYSSFSSLETLFFSLKTFNDCMRWTYIMEGNCFSHKIPSEQQLYWCLTKQMGSVA